MYEEIYLPPQDIRSVAVIGTGSVGASWTALFLASEMGVVAYDPVEGAVAQVCNFVNKAWPALRKLGIARTETAPLDLIRFAGSAAEAARSADLIQENVPENPELKARRDEDIFPGQGAPLWPPEMAFFRRSVQRRPMRQQRC